MACPLFLPSSPLAGCTDLYGGECAADAGALIPVDLLHRSCNAGYARDCCARAAQSEADAFRFLVKANREGMVEIAWSSERNHHPVAVGNLVVNPAVGSREIGPLERQARV